MSHALHSSSGDSPISSKVVFRSATRRRNRKARGSPGTTCPCQSSYGERDASSADARAQSRHSHPERRQNRLFYRLSMEARPARRASQRPLTAEDGPIILERPTVTDNHLPWTPVSGLGDPLRVRPDRLPKAEVPARHVHPHVEPGAPLLSDAPITTAERRLSGKVSPTYLARTSKPNLASGAGSPSMHARSGIRHRLNEEPALMGWTCQSNVHHRPSFRNAVTVYVGVRSRQQLIRSYGERISNT